MTHYYDSKESPLKHWKGSRCQIKKVPFLNWSILGQGHQLVAPRACASASTSYPWNEGISATPVPSPTNIKRQVGSVAHHPTSTPLPSYVHSKESFRCKYSKRRGDKCEKRYRNGGRFSKRHSGRPLPKRGQVKVGIVVGIAHSFASIFSPRSWRSRSGRRTQLEGWDLRLGVGSALFGSW